MRSPEDLGDNGQEVLTCDEYSQDPVGEKLLLFFFFFFLLTDLHDKVEFHIKLSTNQEMKYCVHHLLVVDLIKYIIWVMIVKKSHLMDLQEPDHYPKLEAVLDVHGDDFLGPLYLRQGHLVRTLSLGKNQGENKHFFIFIFIFALFRVYSFSLG